MFEFIIDHVTELLSVILGGGVVALFTIPETKASKRLDAAERVLAKYEPLLQKLEKENTELRSEIATLREKVAVQSSTIVELKTKIHTMEIINQEDRALRCEKTACPKRVPSFVKENLEKLAEDHE